MHFLKRNPEPRFWIAYDLTLLKSHSGYCCRLDLCSNSAMFL